MEASQSHLWSLCWHSQCQQCSPLVLPNVPHWCCQNLTSLCTWRKLFFEAKFGLLFAAGNRKSGQYWLKWERYLMISPNRKSERWAVLCIGCIWQLRPCLISTLTSLIGMVLSPILSPCPEKTLCNSRQRLHPKDAKRRGKGSTSSLLLSVLWPDEPVLSQKPLFRFPPRS